MHFKPTLMGGIKSFVWLWWYNCWLIGSPRNMDSCWEAVWSCCSGVEDCSCLLAARPLIYRSFLLLGTWTCCQLLPVRKMLRLESQKVASRLWITEVSPLLLLEQEFAFLMLTHFCTLSNLLAQTGENWATKGEVLPIWAISPYQAADVWQERPSVYCPFCRILHLDWCFSEALISGWSRFPVLVLMSCWFGPH